MRLIRIEIEEFGKLTDLSLTLGEGMNLIEGKNESGKSTLLAFLRFALYGFPRRNSEGGEERDKRISWRSRRAAGSLTLEFEGEAYRITRSFLLRGTAAREMPSESLTVVRVSDGGRVSLNGKTPGEYFLGLPAELYDSSLCLSQSDAERVSSPAVREALGELLFSGEMTLCSEDAAAKLKAARRDLQHLKGRGGRIAALEDELARLDAEIAKASADAARLADLRAEAHRTRGEAKALRERLFATAAAFEGAGIDRTLALFEARGKAVEQLHLAKGALDDANRYAASLPDKEGMTRAALALREVESAREKITRLAPEVARLEGLRHDERLLKDAALATERGGAQAILDGITAARAKAKGAGISALVFLILALLCAAPILLLPQFLLYFAAGGGLLAVISLVCLLTFTSRRKKATVLVADFGASSPAMLRTYLEQCERERQSFEAHEKNLALLQIELANARKAEQDAIALLQTEFVALHPTGEMTAESARELLREVLELQKRAEEIRAAALLDFERAKSACETLDARLAGQDEAELRARRARLPEAREGVEELSRRQAELERTMREAEARATEAERAESTLAATAKNPEELARERTALQAELGVARRRLAAIDMALAALDEGADALRRGITPRLAEDASRLFAELTDGAYSKLLLGNDFSISLEGDGIPLPLSRFSAGCRDAAHLSLRLALLRTLSDERLPLFFDEAFSRLDDDRALALLGVLQRYCQAGGQALLFTCHSREREMLGEGSDTAFFVL